MAAMIKVRGGYEYKFEEEPPEGLRCVICQAVARQPQQHAECGKLFCSSCITQYTLTSNQCPNCELQLNTFYDGKSDQQVKALLVKCDNSVNGCKWVGTLNSVFKHGHSCEFTVMSCPNHCEKSHLHIKLLRKDIDAHLAICPNRTHQCPHCDILGPYHELTTSHLDSCPKVEVHCPHPECNLLIQRCHLDTHTQNCTNKPLRCKYAEMGCTAQLKPEDSKEHEDNDLLHLKLTKEMVLKLTELLEEREKRFQVFIDQRITQISNLRHKISQCVRMRGPATFKFREFDQHKLQDKFFLSPPFYLETGYRFRVSVWANGYGGSKNTHVSVFAFLAEGQDDEYLTWPFKGSLNVEILNQLADKSHFKRVIRFIADEEISGRVEGIQKYGWGLEKFISNKQLANVSSKCQYLKGDTLYFRVSSVPESVKKKTSTDYLTMFAE